MGTGHRCTRLEEHVRLHLLGLEHSRSRNGYDALRVPRRLKHKQDLNNHWNYTTFDFGIPSWMAGQHLLGLSNYLEVIW